MHSPPCIFLFYFVSLMHLFLCSCLFLSRYMFWDVRETQMEGHLVHCLCTPLAHRHYVCFKINTTFVSCVYHICLITLLIFVPLSPLLVSPTTTVASQSRLYIFVSVIFLPWQLTFKILRSCSHEILASTHVWIQTYRPGMVKHCFLKIVMS